MAKAPLQTYIYKGKQLITRLTITQHFNFTRYRYKGMLYRTKGAIEECLENCALSLSEICVFNRALREIKILIHMHGKETISANARFRKQIKKG